MYRSKCMVAGKCRSLASEWSLPLSIYRGRSCWIGGWRSKRPLRGLYRTPALSLRPFLSICFDIQRVWLPDQGQYCRYVPWSMGRKAKRKTPRLFGTIGTWPWTSRPSRWSCGTLENVVYMTHLHKHAQNNATQPRKAHNALVILFLKTTELSEVGHFDS